MKNKQERNQKKGEKATRKRTETREKENYEDGSALIWNSSWNMCGGYHLIIKKRLQRTLLLFNVAEGT